MHPLMSVHITAFMCMHDDVYKMCDGIYNDMHDAWNSFVKDPEVTIGTARLALDALSIQTLVSKCVGLSPIASHLMPLSYGA